MFLIGLALAALAVWALVRLGRQTEGPGARAVADRGDPVSDGPAGRWGAGAVAAGPIWPAAAWSP